MEILVIHYTSWIGYHVVDGLLNEGHMVYGFEGEDGNQQLSDFFGRNSNFNKIEEFPDQNFSHVICVGDLRESYSLNMGKLLMIDSNTVPKLENMISLEIPYLFGEFMPMDDRGFIYNGKRVEFSSELFQKEGVYITEFIKIILHWVEETADFKEIMAKAVKNVDKVSLRLDKSFLVHENVPIGKELRVLMEHYKQHQDYYPKLEN